MIAHGATTDHSRRCNPIEGIAIRRATGEDEAFLWRMLYYASRMDRQPDRVPDDARRDPYLSTYVEGWGRAGDLGCIAVDAASGQPLGAAWLRALPKPIGPEVEGLPEVATAVLPGYEGRGIGTRLLTCLVDTAQGVYPALALSVRDDNPALRLYERVGFVIVGEIVNRVGGRSHVMRLDLGAKS